MAGQVKKRLVEEYRKRFLEFVNSDLNTPKALALTWKLIKDDKLSNKEKYNLLLDFDKVFGLNLDKVKKTKIPQKIRNLAKKREQLRKESQWKEADKIRKGIKKLGYQIEDTKKGPKIKKL